MTHPAHFTRRVPVVGGFPVAVERYPEPGEVPDCGSRRHTWHSDRSGPLAVRRCCQCGRWGRALWGRPEPEEP